MTDQRKVILHADDEHGWREYVASKLSPEYQVEFTRDFETTLARLAKGGIDLLILDHLMPGTQPLDDAVAVCAHLRRRHPGLPIVVFTGSLVDSPTTREELERMVVAPVVCKEDVESDQDDLRTRVEQLLGKPKE